MNFVYEISSILWNVFLPFIIIIGIFVIYKTYVLKKESSNVENKEGSLWGNRGSLVISLSSKIGTGAIIGVLAAMNRLSSGSSAGEGIVIWILIGMFILIPLTYSEVYITKYSKKTPREFIENVFNKQTAKVYIISLVVLYSFGFAGFQLSGIQSVLKISSESFTSSEFNSQQILIFVILPIIIGIFLIIITRSHTFFIKVLGSFISFLITLYLLFFIFFLIKTYSFIPEYLNLIIKDFLNIHSMSFGVPIGLIIGFQRIIQISETSLGTSAMGSANIEKDPHNESLLQSIAAIFTLFIAVIITSYIFSYGHHMISDVELSSDSFSRIYGYLFTANEVTGIFGLIVVIIFFLISGFTTILGSFHFLNSSLNFSENKKIMFYMILISTSGVLSVLNFNIIFDVVDLLMFVSASIMILSMAVFLFKTNKKRI